MPAEQIPYGHSTQKSPAVEEEVHVLWMAGLSRGPAVDCNVTKRGRMSGIDGRPNAAAICIHCTTPDFPDKFMPFMDGPPRSRLCTAMIQTCGLAIRALRSITPEMVNKERKWRKPGSLLLTGRRQPAVH